MDISQFVFSADMIWFAIFLSAVISMLVYERWGISTGGTIVAGYLALFIVRPTQVIITLGIAVTTYLIVHKYLRPRMMLWGRRLFEVEILVALVLQTSWFIVISLLSSLTIELTFLFGIGFLLPGLMAHDMGRQGVKMTLQAAILSAIVIFGILVMLSSVISLAGVGSMVSVVNETAEFTYPIEWLIIAINLSVLFNIALYHRIGAMSIVADDAIRTGGFVTAAYFALFLAQPITLVFILLCSILTYLFVTRYLMQKAVLFGRSKLVAMFLTGFVITAVVRQLLFFIAPNLIFVSGFSVVVPTLVSLLANDAQRQGLKQTFVGLGSSTLAISCVMLLLVSFAGA